MFSGPLGVGANGLQPCSIPPLSAPDTQPIAAGFEKVLGQRWVRGVAHGAQRNPRRARFAVDESRHLTGQRRCKRHDRISRRKRDTLRHVGLFRIAQMLTVRSAPRAGPLANYPPQLVGLLLQLPNPLLLHRQIPTDFRDPTFDNIRQFGASRLPGSSGPDCGSRRSAAPT